MDSLFTLQYTCLLVFAMLMLQLLVSRLYQNSTTPQYEKSRLLLIATMLVLVVHYALQISLELRANDDNVGHGIQHAILSDCQLFPGKFDSTDTNLTQNHASICHCRLIGLSGYNRRFCIRMVHK